jgi:hypothetical protein
VYVAEPRERERLEQLAADSSSPDRQHLCRLPRHRTREHPTHTKKNTESVARKKAQPKSDGEDETLTHLDSLFGCGGHGGGTVQGFQRGGVWGEIAIWGGQRFGGRKETRKRAAASRKVS